MNHVPKPPGSHLAPTEVPLLATLEYDFRGYASFPYRNGFIKDGKLDEDRSPDALAAFMQSWLYFGLIAEFTMQPVKIGDFTFTSPSGSYNLVSSKRLFDILSEWNCRLRRLRLLSPSWRETVTATKNLLITAIRASCKFDYLAGLDDSRYAAIALSVKTLLVTLIWAYNTLLPDIKLDVHEFCLIPWHSFHDLTLPHPARYLHQELRNLGWCPALIQRICRRYNYYAVIFLAQIPRKEPRYAIHTRCSSTDCVAFNVSESTYETRHVHENCRCKAASVLTEKIVKIIEDGQIPLVNISRSPGPHLEVVPTKQGDSSRRYIALSHVWADGLGNPKENALPRCQIARIADLLLPKQTLFGKFGTKSILIWVDTLCIPVGDKFTAVRLQAIDQMALVYASADEVLVLDSSLTQLYRPQIESFERNDPPAVGLELSSPLFLRSSSFYLEWSEVLGRILCSPWAGRSWTLQEAVVPQHVQFALSKGSMSSKWLDAISVPASAAKKPYLSEKSVFSDLYLLMTTTFVRTVLTGFRLCCVPQMYARCHEHPFRVWSSKSRLSQRQSLNCLVGMIYLLLATGGALEILFLHTLYVFIIAIECVLTLPFALSLWLLSVPFILTQLAIMAKADCRWLQARLQSNQLEDIMRHTLFTDLVNYTKDMLVLDSKSLVAASRGRPDIFERAESSHLAQIWNSLSDRSTTKPNDIHYILGTLTNRNVRSLKNSSSQERMESILRTFTYVPADLMLTYDAQSMNKIINNNTWLPAFPKGGLLSEKTVLRVLPHGFELCIGDADSIASVYTLDRNWENPKLVFLCRPGATVAYEVETLRTATESSDTRAAMPSPNTCILILGSGNPQHDPPNCLHAVQLEVVCQEQQPVQLHYKSLLRLKVAVIEKIPSAPASYIELKETLPPHTRCIILHGSQASQASNAIEDCGSTAEPHGPSYQPPFGLTGTLAHYTFFRLAMFNVAAIFIPTIVALAYPHITHARIAGIVIAAICWLIAASAIDYLCEISLSLAWHAHYDATTPAASSTTTKPVPVSRFMRRFNAFMDEWNRAIVLNFPVSDDNVEDLRQGWGMRAASAEQILAGPGKGRSLRRYLVPAREDTMVDVENSTGDMAFGPYLKNSLASFYTRIEGLSEPTLRASWDSRILRRLGLARKLR